MVAIGNTAMQLDGLAGSTASKRKPVATLADPDLNGLRHGTVAGEN
jgi:hypothetical protein